MTVLDPKMALLGASEDRAFLILHAALSHFSLEDGRRLIRCGESLVSYANHITNQASRYLLNRMLRLHGEFWTGVSDDKTEAEVVSSRGGQILEWSKPYTGICFRICYEELAYRIAVVDDCERIMEREEAPKLRRKKIKRRLVVRRDVWPFVTPSGHNQRIRRFRSIPDEYRSVLVSPPAVETQKKLEVADGSIVHFLRTLYQEAKDPDGYVSYENRLKKHLRQDDEITKEGY